MNFQKEDRKTVSLALTSMNGKEYVQEPIREPSHAQIAQTCDLYSQFCRVQIKHSQTTQSVWASPFAQVPIKL